MTKTARVISASVLTLGIITGIAAYLFMAPFYSLPRTEFVIDRFDARPAYDIPTAFAGIAVTDITTGFNVPKFGYSAHGKSADGFRNRLKARAFYIKPASGQPLAIVQTDLPATSAILHHRVAELIAHKTDIGLHNLSITSTHTHNGPGGFLSSDFYNYFGSNLPGFDPAILEFLSGQIAAALIKAHADRRPAKIAIGQKDVLGLTANRSINAHVLNPDARATNTDSIAALQAVNPTLTMIRIDLKDDAGNYLPAGALSSFSMHGTGIPAKQAPYHADAWAYLSREVQWSAQRQLKLPWKFVHGAFQATSGDVSQSHRVDARGELEARRVGTDLSTAAWELFQSLDAKLTSSIEIEAGMKEINLLTIDSDLLCDRAIIGTPLLAGALGDEVFPMSFMYPFKAGSRRTFFTDGCHAEKLWVSSVLQPYLFKPEDFPHKLVLHLMRINGLVMFGLPFEVTTQAGIRIMNALKNSFKQTNTTVNHIALNSISNGYFGYATTREEYARQYYEGGHTLYGPGTTDFLANEAKKMAKQLNNEGNFSDLPDQWKLALLTRQYAHTTKPSKAIQREQLNTTQYFTTGPMHDDYWSAIIADVEPGAMQLHKPLLSIQTRFKTEPWKDLVINEVPINDQGYDLQIRLINELKDDLKHGRASYELRWYNPQVASEGQYYRFKIEARGKNKAFTTNAFR